MPRFLLFLLCWIPPSFAADARLARDGVEIFISARTPEQVTAFYSARGLPPAGLQELSKVCFLTVSLHNRRTTTLWLEPASWRFMDAQGKPITRVSRQEWTRRWTSLQVPLAAQSTFGWTQLPESRDLYPEESVGGNIAILPPVGNFSVITHFRTGAEGEGQALELTIPGLSCPREGPTK